jgi:hypothetical protein
VDEVVAHKVQGSSRLPAIELDRLEVRETAVVPHVGISRSSASTSCLLTTSSETFREDSKKSLRARSQARPRLAGTRPAATPGSKSTRDKGEFSGRGTQSSRGRVDAGRHSPAAMLRSGA